MELDGDDGSQTLARIIAGKVAVLFLENPLPARIIVHGARNALLEAVEVGTAIDRVDVVCERKHVVGGIRRGPLHRHFDDAIGVFRLEIDGFVEGFLALIEELHEILESAHSLEDLFVGVALSVDVTFIDQGDLESLVQEGHLAETSLQGQVVIDRGLPEDLGIGPKRDRRSRMGGRADLVELLLRLAVIERNLVLLAIATHLNDDARGKRVDDRDADAVKTAGDLVTATAELTAGMKDGQNDFDRRDLLFGMLVHGNAATVVNDGDGVVFMDGDVDGCAVTGKRFVDRVVDDLVHQVMQAARAGRADVHARTLTHRFQAFENLNLLATVLSFVLSHVSSLSDRVLRKNQRRQLAPPVIGRRG